MKKTRMGAFLMSAALLAGFGWEGPVPAVAEEVEIMVQDQISPIIDREGADPFVTTYGDQYLYTKTTGSNVSIAVADSIQTLGAAEMKCVFEPGAELRDLWAPEIWNLDGSWYIYFAAVYPGDEMHYMFVLSNPSENPMEGEWTCEQLMGMDDKFAIDGTIMELNGKRYFLWSGWEGYENVRQDIYLAEMVSPTEVMEEKILLSMPEYDWEMNGNPLINEGPEAVVRGNTVNLIYSASGSWTDDYCLGLLTMDAAADPKVPENWTKQDSPVLSQDLDVYGPGHNCFTVSADGTEDLNIYHAARWMRSGWNRSIRYGYVTFDENGMIQPMEVTSGEELLQIPSGEEEVRIYPADCFTVSKDVDIRGDQGKRYAGGFWDTSDTAEFVITAEEEEDVTAVVFVRTDDLLPGVISGIELSVNGEKGSQELFSSENYQPLYFPVHLNQGENNVKLRSDVGGSYLEITRVELRK